MRVGSVVYATEQGLGRLAKSFYDSGIVTDPLIFQHPDRRPTRSEWYPPNTVQISRRTSSIGVVERFLSEINVLLAFETPFDWRIVQMAKARGIPTVLIPMYEWHLENPPIKFDHYINPSLLDQDYFPQGRFIPVPVVGITWSLRKKARKFLHNSGHVGSRNHKGTVELLQAMQYVKSPIELTIRSQQPSKLKRLVESTPGAALDKRINFVFGEVPYDRLFDPDFDAYIAPEKYNGLSLPLQEARASGMLVITTDRYPTNTWLPQETLIPVERYQKVRAAGGHLEIDESVVSPIEIARVIDNWYDRDIEAYSLSGKSWADEMSWDSLRSKYIDVLREIAKCP